MRPRRLSLILAAAVSTVVLAACGSSSPSSNGVASKTPQQILSAVQAAILTAKSVHVSGSLVSGGQPVSVDLHIVSGKGGEGRIAVMGLGAQVIGVNGTIYIKGDQSFWSHFGGAAAATLFQGKWLKAPETGSFASFAQLTNLNTLFSKALATHGVLSKGSTTKISGQPAIAITDTTQGGTLYVATTGQPYPLEISKSGADGGKVIFDQYNQSVTLTAPKNAIDISKFQGA
jgi:hypothetical protein